MTFRLAWLGVAGALVVGCSGADETEVSSIAKNDKPKKCKQHKRKNKTHGDCTTVTTMVGLQGGTVTLPAGGPSLSIPFGALPSNTTITITETDEAPPPGIGAVGPIFEFEPEGLVFAKPVTVSLPMPPGVTTGQVYWSQLGGPGFDAIGGTISGGRITTQAVHFSLAVIGSPLGTQTLQGTSVDTWISANHAPHFEGTSQATAAPSTQCSEIEAIVDDGTGGYARICGSFATDRKTFAVPGVPLGGDYMLHVRDADSGLHTLLVASTQLPDLGRHLGGRPYPTSSSSDPLLAARTAITGTAYQDFHVDGLNGWYGPGERSPNDVGDQIELFSTEADNFIFNAEATNPPTSGTLTSTADLPLHWDESGNTFVPALIQGIAPNADRVLVAKLEGNTANGHPYQSMTRVGVAAPFDLIDNDTVSGNVTLAPMAPGPAFSVTFDGAAHYAALLADGNPLGIPAGDGLSGGFVGILAQGGDAQFGFYTANADLLLLFDNNPTGTFMNTGPMPVATAGGLPGSWGELADARWVRFHQLVLPDTSGPSPGAGFRDVIDWVTTRDKLTGTVGPKLTQVRNPRVNGTHFFTGAPSVGTTTTLTWDLPATGVPLYYAIGVRELFVGPNNRTGGKQVAQVFTQDRSFTFPPGILDPGKTYAFAIGAYLSTGTPAQAAALVAAPFKTGLHVAKSIVTSNIFGSAHGTPPPPDAITVATGLAFPTGIAVSASGIYWTDRYDSFWNDPWTDAGLGAIWTSDLDGNNPHTIATGQHAPNSIAASDTYVFWVNNGLGPDATIESYKLSDGSRASFAEPGAGAVAVTPAGDLVYCSGGGTFVRAGGTGAPSWIAPWCGHLAADTSNAYITVYATGPGNTGKIVQAALDGSGEIDLATDRAQSFDVETSAGVVYWTDQAWQQSFPASVNRVDVGGGNLQTLFEGNQILKIFAIDGGYAYFVQGDSVLYRLALDGSSNGVAEPVATLPTSCPEGDMAAYNGHIAWTDVCSGATYLVIP